MPWKAALSALLIACCCAVDPALALVSGSRAAAPGAAPIPYAVLPFPSSPILSPSLANPLQPAPLYLPDAALSAPAMNAESAALSAPAALAATALPAESALSPALSPSFIENAPAQAALPGSERGQAPLDAFAGAKALAAAVSGPRNEISAPSANAAFFDGAPLRAANATPGAAPPGDVGSGGGPGGLAPRDSGGDGRLGRLYPRVVMILDAFTDTAPEPVVQHIETLIDKGVHVVFVTPRPERGENSAHSVLISKLRVRTGNPVIVVSYNGARIAAHNSHAANPKPIIEDQPGIPENTLAKFREIDQRLRAKFHLKKASEEFGAPSLEAPHIYGAQLPDNVSAAKWTIAFNRALRSAGLRYKIEAVESPERRSYFTQSTALRLNTGRIFNALYAMAPELDPAKGDTRALKPSEVLILADPAKAPSFLQSLPGRGYFVHGVNDAGSLRQALAAVLHGDGLETVNVNKYDLREYLEWLERRQRYGAGGGSGGPGRSRPNGGNSPAYHALAFHRGIVIKEVMSRLYHSMKNHALQDATLEASHDLLEKLWRYPESNGINLPDEVKYARQTQGWKMMQGDALIVAKRWLTNYYHRNFPDYPRNVDQKVSGRLLRLARDGDSVSLHYASPYTGRKYKVWTRPDRTELWEDEKGYILVAHVYRTGKEPYQKQFEESVEVNLLGRTLLEGDAQKRADGRWYVNNEPDPRVMVIFHYNTRDLQTIHTPAEVESHTPEVTALIEKREADKEYQAWRAERDKANERAKIAAKSAATRATNARAKAKAQRERTSRRNTRRRR